MHEFYHVNMLWELIQQGSSSLDPVYIKVLLLQNPRQVLTNYYLVFVSLKELRPRLSTVLLSLHCNRSTCIIKVALYCDRNGLGFGEMILMPLGHF